MSDLIDRQAAIDVLDEQIEQCNKSLSSFDISMKDEYAAKVERASLAAFREILEYLPPAQLGTNLAEVGTDCISRQQVIGALRNYLVGKNVPCDGTLTCRLIENEVINKLPFAELGTNLAEVGTDCISRQAAINKILGQPPELHYPSWYAEQIKELPSAQLDTYWKEQCQSYEQTINKLRESLSTQPEIIRCKDCKHRDNYGCCKHWKGLAMGDIPIATDDNDFCSQAERRTE